MSFSAHADAKGIMQLIRHCEPKNVMFVHGENEKMDFLKQKVMQEFNINCYKPANGETAIIPVPLSLNLEVSLPLLKQTISSSTSPCLSNNSSSPSSSASPEESEPKKPKLLHSVLVMKNNVGYCELKKNE